MFQISENFSFDKNSRDSFLVIAGPCQLESKELSFKVAEYLKNLCEKLKLPFVFKSSYDKANRTSLTGQRGMGIEAGLKLLADIKHTFDVPILTDVHSVEEVYAAASVVDILQIPAFLCRQTDILLAAGKTGKAVNIKKGQFLHPNDMKFAAEKIASTGNDKVLLCERGTCFGYRDLIVDFRGLLMMKESGCPVIFDATHSVQSMGGEGGASGGSREYILPLAKAAIAVGVDGIFIECHPDPDKAPSDAKSMLKLSDMEEVLSKLVSIKSAS
jgi:2-dehydro-3-deoxyphosphooctonate aldolase (KDO 8-P synthase)